MIIVWRDWFCVSIDCLREAISVWIDEICIFNDLESDPDRRWAIIAAVEASWEWGTSLEHPLKTASPSD